jgi:hypothetical protein
MLNKLLFWAAVVCGIIAGIAAIVAAIALKKYVFIAWGITFIVGSILCAVSAGSGRPDGAISPPTIGAVFKEIPGWSWGIIAAMCAGSVVLSIIFPPWKG